MRSWRSVGLVLLALAVAASPGIVRTVAPAGPAQSVERAPLAVTEPRSGATAPTVVEAAAEVPMTPPPADLSGEVAPAARVATPFVESGRSVDGEVLALVIGIDDYPGRRSDLQAAVADADTIDSALAGFGVPPANRVVLRDGQARRADVVRSIQALVSRAGEGSTVVFAYAGHVRKVGHRREALVTADGGLITDEELAVMLGPMAAQRAWLLLATCYAGGFTEALAPGRVLTGAAGADEIAYESPDLKASFLVHHLVREGWLQGMAGPSVQEAFAYADARLAATRPDRRPVQHDAYGQPLLLGDAPSTGSAQAPVPARAPSGPPPSTPPPTTTTTSPERRCTLLVLCGG